MIGKYIDGSTLDQALDAHRQGVPIDRLAERLRIEPDDLRRRLGLPTTATPVPAADDDSGDLWAVDRLDGLL
ncbi:MAG: hypothetical protein WKF77_06245 [Planctomycetaceae bacterium]